MEPRRLRFHRLQSTIQFTQPETPVAECGLPDGRGSFDPARLLAVGPTLQVNIGFDVNFKPGSNTIPDLPSTLYPALIDTGAAASCIDSTVASSLNLPISDHSNFSGVLGAGEVNMHIAQIYIPDLEMVFHGSFAGVHLLAGNQHHSALIGRNILLKFKMYYDGRTGRVTISD